MNAVRRKLRTSLGLLLLLQLIMPGCAKLRPTIDLSTISPADEVVYGESVNGFVLQRLGSLCMDDSVQSYLERVGARLNTGKRANTFALTNDPVPAAFTLPAGKIILTRGMFYYIQTEEELTVLLAHMVGHDMVRHGLQAAVMNQPVQRGSDQFSLPDKFEAATVSSRLLSEPFTDDQETLADQYAKKVLLGSGYESASVSDVLSRIYERLAESQHLPTRSFPNIHPLSDNRLKLSRAGKMVKADVDELDSLSFIEARESLLQSRSAYQKYQKALEYEKQGEIDRAIELYLQSAVAAPEEVLLLTGLGMAYMRQDVLVAARQHLTRAARIDSQYYHPQLGLGYIYLQQQDLTQAAKRLRRSQALLPTALGGYFLAQVFDEAGNSQAALTAYRDVAKHYQGSKVASLAEKRVVELESTFELE